LLPGLRVSVEFKDVLVVARAVAAGTGDAGEAGLAGGADGEVAEGGAVGGQVPGSGFLGVLAEGDDADVVAPVLDRPVLAGVDGQVAGAGEACGRLVMP